jgi:hypothetical protein
VNKADSQLREDFVKRAEEIAKTFWVGFNNLEERKEWVTTALEDYEDRETWDTFLKKQEEKSKSKIERQNTRE